MRTERDLWDGSGGSHLAEAVGRAAPAEPAKRLGYGEPRVGSGAVAVEVVVVVVVIV